MEFNVLKALITNVQDFFRGGLVAKSVCMSVYHTRACKYCKGDCEVPAYQHATKIIAKSTSDASPVYKSLYDQVTFP